VIVTLGLILSYWLDIRGLLSSTLNYKQLEQNMIYQALIVTAVGLVSFIVLVSAGDSYKTMVVTLMAVIRIGLETLLYRKSLIKIK